jgi:phage terminase large subunit-like protein
MLGRLLARNPANGRRRHRYALIGVPRKNGKTAIVAGLGLYGVLLEKPGAEVYAVAGDRAQARLVFGTARRAVELDPELSGILKLYRDAIEEPTTGSVFRVLSAEAPLKEGLSPTLTIVDEVHVIERELWDVFALAMGARLDPLLVGITTAGARFDARGEPTLCYQLWDRGRRIALGEIDDPTFYFEWWAAPDDADHRDPATWAMANPGLGDILDPADLAAALGPTPEAEFRTKRLNQWVASGSTAFPAGAFEACADVQGIPDGTDVVLAFDGSWTGDSSALVAATIAERPHIVVAGHWERPIDDLHWRVDSDDVAAAIRQALARWRVREIAADPAFWASQLREWSAAGWPLVEWPSHSPSRIVPAWAAFYAAVMERRLTHDGNPALVRHAANAVLKQDHRGARPVKETDTSARKIDLLIAAILAYDRAIWHAGQPRRAKPFLA